MPIRFRCAYCNQLMGIASRKAGSVVRCPKCAGEIIVPTPEGESSPVEGTEPSSGPMVFENPQFDATFNAAATGPAVPPIEIAPAPAPVELPIPPVPLALEPLPPAAPVKRSGLFVPLGMLITSMIIVTLLLILVFVLGILIGKHLGTP